jgi:hypothetical protein
MITVSIKQLVSAIAEADTFTLPAMSAGTAYLYDGIYKRLTCGEEVRLSGIDWSRFELEDVDTMRDLYSDVLEANESKADRIVGALRGIAPTVAAAAFV